jgi:mono/diheme cytochrome c family protein
MKITQKYGCILVTSTLLQAVSIDVRADAAAGKAIYEGKGACFSCHGLSGKGDGPAAASLNPKPQDFSTSEFVLDTDGDGQKGTDTDLYNVIRDGAAKYGGAATMPGRPDLSEQEIKDLIEYIHSFR